MATAERKGGCRDTGPKKKLLSAEGPGLGLPSGVTYDPAAVPCEGSRYDEACAGPAALRRAEQSGAERSSAAQQSWLWGPHGARG